MTKPSNFAINSLPIAVFDSGVGGLSVLRTLQEYLPNESFLYLGDMARVPYGTKSANAVIRYSLSAANFLISQYHIKLLVIACHTASTLALDTLERTFNLPIVGMIDPGAQAACAMTKNNHIAVIATEATVKAQGYQKAILQIRQDAQIVAQACSLFVALAEEGWVKGPIAELVAQQYLSPLFNGKMKPDCLLLGCTHFPLLTHPIKTVIGKDTLIIDPAIETAQSVKRILNERGLSNAQDAQDAKTEFLVTDAPDRFIRVAEQFLAAPIPSDQIKVVDTYSISQKGSSINNKRTKPINK